MLINRHQTWARVALEMLKAFDLSVGMSALRVHSDLAAEAVEGLPPIFYRVDTRNASSRVQDALTGGETLLLEVQASDGRWRRPSMKGDRWFREFEVRGCCCWCCW